HAVHFCLALGLQAAYGFGPGAIVFERPLGKKRVDVSLTGWDVAIEVKYQRPIPSKKNRPSSQLYGGLLADFNKVASARATRRFVVLVIDTPGINYLNRNSRGLLVFEKRRAASVSLSDLAKL